MAEDDTQVEQVERVNERGEKLYLIKGSMLQHEDGSLTPTKMFDILNVPLDDYSDLAFTETEVKRMRMHVMKMRTGVQAMAPINCAGPVKCPFRQRCPIIDKSILTDDLSTVAYDKQDIKRFPIMRQCFFEKDFLEFQRRSYIEEYSVDVESPTELTMVNKLAELDLYEYRATLVLANGDERGEGQDLLKEQVTGITMNGTKIKRLEIHPVFELKEKIHRMREEILKSMVGTRREKYKQAAALKQNEFDDISNDMSELRDKILELSRETALTAVYTEIPTEE